MGACLPIGASGRNYRLDGKSRMRREPHVRFREGVGVRFPRATRHLVELIPITRDGTQLLNDILQGLSHLDRIVNRAQCLLLERSRPSVPELKPHVGGVDHRPRIAAADLAADSGVGWVRVGPSGARVMAGRAADRVVGGQPRVEVELRAQTDLGVGLRVVRGHGHYRQRPVGQHRTPGARRSRLERRDQQGQNESEQRNPFHCFLPVRAGWRIPPLRNTARSILRWNSPELPRRRYSCGGADTSRECEVNQGWSARREQWCVPSLRPAGGRCRHSGCRLRGHPPAR